MPVFKRGKGLGGWLADSEAKRRKCDDDDSSSRSDDPVGPPPDKLAFMSRIGYQSDKWHSLYRYLPEDTWSLKEILRKEIGSFLNGAGGVLCFGCRENGAVYGLVISRKKEDDLRLTIDHTISRFHPFVHPNNYRVLFKEVASVKGIRERRIVIEIKITACSRFIMYEDESHEVYLRVEDKYKGPLTPHEIKDLVTDLYYKRIAANAEKSSVNNESSSVTSHPLEVHHTSSKEDEKSSTSTSSSSTSHSLEVCHKASKQGDKSSASTSSTNHSLEVCHKACKQGDKSSASTNHPLEVGHKARKQGKNKSSTSASSSSSHPLEVYRKASKQDSDGITRSNKGDEGIAHDTVTTTVDSKPPPLSTTTGPTPITRTSGNTFKRLVRKFNLFGSSKSSTSEEPDSRTEVSYKSMRISRKRSRSKRNKKKVHVACQPPT